MKKIAQFVAGAVVALMAWLPSKLFGEYLSVLGATVIVVFILHLLGINLGA